MPTKIDQFNKIHFIGIGGIGMSALARLFLHEGKEVSGSDRSESVVTDGLKREGVDFYNQDGPTILQDSEKRIDLVVYSDAIPPDHQERQEAMRQGIPAMSYFEALGEIANEYFLIVVAGTHGKTTTTAMIADVLEAAELDPTVVVGSLRAKTKSNFRAGKSKYFVVEGDEYRRHFLAFRPDALIITNIEADHLDYYKDLTDIESAFHELALRVPAEGVIVADTASESVKKVVEGAAAAVRDYRAFIDPLLPLQVIGTHNYQNAAAALALAEHLSIDGKVARQALTDFTGTWRRFEYKGQAENGAVVYDDYAHHPTEIKTTLRAAREKFADKKIIVAFHPHLYSRTKQLFNDFAAAFKDADQVVIAPIFAAREEDDGSISNRTLAEAIEKNGTRAAAPDSFESIEQFLHDNSDADSIIITMGAGDIYKIAESLTK